MANKIILRHAKDGYHALLTAQGMEDANASVFSITHTDSTVVPFIVWAKYDENEISPDHIDDCINFRMKNANI